MRPNSRANPSPSARSWSPRPGSKSFVRSATASRPKSANPARGAIPFIELETALECSVTLELESSHYAAGDRLLPSGRRTATQLIEKVQHKNDRLATFVVGANRCSARAAHRRICPQDTLRNAHPQCRLVRGKVPTVDAVRYAPRKRRRRKGQSSFCRCRQARRPGASRGAISLSV